MVLAKIFWKYDLAWFNRDEVDWERDSKGYTLWEKPNLRCIFVEREKKKPRGWGVGTK